MKYSQKGNGIATGIMVSKEFSIACRFVKADSITQIKIAGKTDTLSLDFYECPKEAQEIAETLCSLIDPRKYGKAAIYFDYEVDEFGYVINFRLKVHTQMGLGGEPLYHEWKDIKGGDYSKGWTQMPKIN